MRASAAVVLVPAFGSARRARALVLASSRWAVSSWRSHLLRYPRAAFSAARYWPLIRSYSVIRGTNTGGIRASGGRVPGSIRSVLSVRRNLLIGCSFFRFGYSRCLAGGGRG